MSGRSGWASSPALRPACACDPACGGTQTGVRTLAVPLPRIRNSVGSSVSTHRSGRSVPARSGVMAPAARGAISTPHPSARNLETGNENLCCARPSWAFGWRGADEIRRPFALVLLERCEQCFLVAGFPFARRVGRPSLRRPRGPQRADPGWGVGDAASCGHRGAPPRSALLGRGRRSLGAPRAGVSKRRAAAHPRGKKEASCSEKKGRQPAGQKKSLTQWNNEETAPRVA